MVASDQNGETVALLLTGGTIGIKGADADDALEYADHGSLLGIGEMRQMYALPKDVPTRILEVGRTKSSDISAPFWIKLLHAGLNLTGARGSVKGIVITHGTATLEESAFFLHMTWPLAMPVVLVGSQRPPTAHSSDAQANLSNALRVAASAESIGQGVLVAMNGHVYSARDVTKGSNHQLDAFRSREYGPLGAIEPNGFVSFYRSVTRLHTENSAFAQLPLAPDLHLPRVEVLSVFAGYDGWSVDAAVEAGASGIVLASLAPSLNPSEVDTAVERAIDSGAVVVQSSRAGTGRVLRRQTFESTGQIVSDDLSPQAARIVLMLALHAGMGLEAIQEVFDTH